MCPVVRGARIENFAAVRDSTSGGGRHAQTRLLNLLRKAENTLEGSCGCVCNPHNVIGRRWQATLSNEVRSSQLAR